MYKFAACVYVPHTKELKILSAQKSDFNYLFSKQNLQIIQIFKSQYFYVSKLGFEDTILEILDI
jgi:hypothetical protein